MYKLILLTLSLVISSVASSSSLKIFVIPSAHKLEWSSNKSLISSYLRSQGQAYLDNDFQDASRRAIGHVVAQIDCLSSVRWTGLSINPSRMVPQLLKNGIEGMFISNSNAYMQTEDEIKRFIFNNSKNSLVMKFPINARTCQKMLRMDDVHRAKKILWFGPLMNTFHNYSVDTELGGSGSTYAVALKRLDGSNHIDLTQWLQHVQLPGSRRNITFYSVQSMLDFALTEKTSYPSRTFKEEVIFKKRKVLLEGIEF